MAPRVARRQRTGLDLVNRRRRPPMLSTAQGPRRLGAALLAVLMTVVVAACGGNAATATAPAPASAPPASQPAPADSPATGESPAASPAGYTGPPVTIKYSIWGDPQEITNQTAIADAFHVANPAITVDVDVSDWDAYWTKLQTGLAGGAAPDVFAMDGPLFPDYHGAGRPARPQAVHRQGRLRPDPARRPGRQGLHDRRRRSVRPAAGPEHDRALLQQGHVRRGRHRVSGRHLGLGEARRHREAADQDRRRQDHPVGLLHRDHRHGELLVGAGVAERRRHHGAGQQDDRARHRPGRGRHPVPAGPHLEGQGHAGPGGVG